MMQSQCCAVTNCAVFGLASHPRGSRNAPRCFMLQKPVTSETSRTLGQCIHVHLLYRSGNQIFICDSLTCYLTNIHCLFKGSKEPFLTIPMEGPKVTAALWGPLDQYIITGHENGDLCQWDTKVRVKF